MGGTPSRPRVLMFRDPGSARTVCVLGSGVRFRLGSLLLVVVRVSRRHPCAPEQMSRVSCLAGVYILVDGVALSLCALSLCPSC